MASSEENYLIDVTPYLIHDAHDVIGRLRGRGEGNYTLDKSRSIMYKGREHLIFQSNSEFETMLTFAGSNPGSQVRSVVPSSKSITVRQHHSFIELPDNEYEPRRYDPRAGYYPTSFMDYTLQLMNP